VVLAVLTAAWVTSSVALAQGDRFWTEGAGRPRAGAGGLESFSTLADKVSPAVISLEVRVHGGSGGVDAGQEGMGQGSGFLITADGFALTNHHVVDKASDIRAVLNDGRQFTVRVVGSDASTDLALIQLEGVTGLSVLALGDSAQLKVGDWVLAIGSPLGLQSTVTAGIVSATERRHVHPGREQLYSNFIQTDASINPGNSGGPLLNVAGEVIGINTAINRLGQGIGFAIPINMAKTLLPTLRTRGFVQRSWIGIMIQEIDADLARSFGLTEAMGALVTDVVSGGPGEAAGLESGDVILALDGQKIRTSDELPWLASVAGVDKNVVLTVWRKDKSRKLNLRLAEMPGGATGRPPAEPAPRKSGTGHGIEVQDLKRFSRSDDKGVVVLRIADWSPARSSGLQPGDVVMQVGDAVVEDVAAFDAAVVSKAFHGVVRLKVRRSRSTFYYAFPAPAR